MGLWDFIRQVEQFDGSLFKIINKFIPRKANEVTGLLIEPSILERPKVQRRKPTLTEDVFPQATHVNTNAFDSPGGCILDTGSIYNGSGTSGEYVSYEGTVSSSRWINGLDERKFYIMTSSMETNFAPGSYGNPYELARAGKILGHTDIDGYHFRDNGARYLQQHLLVHDGTSGYTQGSMSFQLTPTSFRDVLLPAAVDQRKSEIYDSKTYFFSSSLSASLHRVYLNMINPWSGPWTELRTKAYSSSRIAADYHDDEVGIQKLAFEGSKLTGPGINKDSPTTIDGGPVISIICCP